MQLLPVTVAGLLDPLYTAFGWIMRMLYYFVDNYGLAVIFFTILIRAILVPFNVKSHKAMMKQQILQPQVHELQRTYAGDKEKASMAQMELYKQHGVSMTGGCLPMLFQLVLIWPVYRIVSGPLTYIMNVPQENLERIGEMLIGTGKYAAFPNVRQMNIPLMQALRDTPSVIAEAVNGGLMRASDLMNLNFLGINLGYSPSWRPDDLFGPQMSTYLPLLLIPLLAIATTFLSSKITEWTSFNYKQQKEDKERAKNNPAMSVDENPSAGMMKSMKWMMPIMTLVFTFQMPAAMGLYWVTGNVLMVLQSLFMYYVYTRPVQHKQAVINNMSQQELAEYNRQLGEDPKIQKRRNKAAARQARMDELLKQQEAMKRGEVPINRYDRSAKDKNADDSNTSGQPVLKSSGGSGSGENRIGTPPKNKKSGKSNKKKGR